MFLQTVIKPNTAECEVVKVLKDSSGTYLRSICIVSNYLYSYPEALSQCRAYHMDLFNVDSTETETIFLSTVNLQFSHIYGNFTTLAQVKKYFFVDDPSQPAILWGDSLYAVCQFFDELETPGKARKRRETPGKNTSKHELNICFLLYSYSFFEQRILSIQ
jgi:hypothetical protein